MGAAIRAWGAAGRYASRQRRGVFISTAGQADANFQGAVMTVEEFFDVWEAQYWGELLCPGIDPKGAIADHPARPKEAFELGGRAVTKLRMS